MALAGVSPILADRLPAVRSGAALALRIAFFSVLMMTLLFYGAIEVWPLTISATLMAAIGGLSVIVCGEPVAARTAFRVGLATALGVAGWILLQSLAFPGNPLANPLWAAAEAILGPLPSAISLAPATTRFSLLWAMMPLTTFLTALVLFASDARAVRLIEVVAWAGGGFAAFAVVQFTVFPDSLLFGPKYFYLDSLSAPFVNRNTAATFYGVIAVVLYALAVGTGDGAPWRRIVALVLSPGETPGRIDSRVVVNVALLAITLAALFLTKSRGGVGATMLAFLFLVPLLATGRGRSGPGRRRQALLRAVFGLAVVLAVIAVFAGRTLLRVSLGAIDDGRFCVLPGILAASRENWPVGTGFGLFRDSFAAFRETGCGISYVWDRAHDMYLEAMLGLGLPAVLLIGIVGSGLAILLIIGIRSRRSLRYVPALGLAVLLLVALHGLVDFSMQIPGCSVVVMTLLAAATTVAAGRRRSGKIEYKSNNRLKQTATAQL